VYIPLNKYGYTNLRASADGDLRNSLANGEKKVELRISPTLTDTFANFGLEHKEKSSKLAKKSTKAPKAPLDAADQTPKYVTRIQNRDGSGRYRAGYRADFKATKKLHGFIGTRAAPKKCAGITTKKS
jgi:hypothetical protein